MIVGSADAPLRYGLNLADGSRAILHIEGESVTWETSGGYWSRCGKTTLEEGEIRVVEMRLCHRKTYSLTLERKGDTLLVTRTRVNGTAVTDEIGGVFGIGNAIINQKGKRQTVSFSTVWKMLEDVSLQRRSAFRRVARAVVSRPLGHAPRAARRDARSASSTSLGSSDDSDGGPDSSDSPDLPASLPLIGGNLRNEFPNNNSHKHRITDLIGKLTFGCAGLLAAVLAPLIAGATR